MFLVFLPYSLSKTSPGQFARGIRVDVSSAVQGREIQAPEFWTPPKGAGLKLGSLCFFVRLPARADHSPSPLRKTRLLSTVRLIVGGSKLNKEAKGVRCEREGNS